MNRIIKATVLLLVLSAFAPKQTGGDFCGLKNRAFQAGETVTMKVFYSTMGMYIGAGEATFTTSIETGGFLLFRCARASTPVLISAAIERDAKYVDRKGFCVNHL